MIIIGVAGGTGAGKTTFVNSISKGIANVAVLSIDNYYRDFGHISQDKRPYLNYDHPNAFDWDLLYCHIYALKTGNAICMPLFSFHTCTRQESTVTIPPPKILIIEGILAFYDERIRSIMDIKIFMDIDSGIRLLRILERDKIERSHSEELVKSKYLNILEPMQKQYIDSMKYLADITITSQNNIPLVENIFKVFIADYASRD